MTFVRVALLLASTLVLGTPGHSRNFGEHGGYDVAAIETSGETREKAVRGYCAMREEFAGPGSTRLTLVRNVETPELIFMVVDNWNWSITADADYESVSYVFSSGRYYERTAKGTVDSIHKGLIAGFPYTEFVSEFRKARSLDIRRQEKVIDELSLEGSAAATAAFERCWTYIQAQDAAKVREWKKFAHIPEDPFAANTGEASVRTHSVAAARAKAPLSSYFSPSDYPASSVRSSEEGTTGVRLEIGANGRVTNCTVTSSSGSSALDSATCRIARARARFTPATDSNGNPTTDTVSDRVTWRPQ